MIVFTIKQNQSQINSLIIEVLSIKKYITYSSVCANLRNAEISWLLWNFGNITQSSSAPKSYNSSDRNFGFKFSSFIII